MLQRDRWRSKTAEFETKEIDENLNQKLSSEKCWLLRYRKQP
jgi:hypothetical protein